MLWESGIASEFSELNISEEKENIEGFTSGVMKRCTRRKTSTTVSSKRNEKLTETADNSERLDSYFLQHDDPTSGKTSNHTLSKLRVGDHSGLPDPVVLEQFRNSYKPKHLPALEKLRSKLGIRLFSNWTFYLNEGFNILLYGIGSKRQIMEDFRKQYLSKANCIVIPGYNSSANIRQILNCICHEFLHIADSCKNPTEQLQSICDLFKKDEAQNSPLFLLLNNIDGPGLRNGNAQAILARLAEVQHIHLIASLDHANMPILWSHNELARFSWIWEDCTNFQNYTEESSYANSQILQNILGGIGSGSDTTGSVGAMLASLRQVAASLTQNARDIFRMIVEYQLETPFQDSKGAINGIAMEDLYWRCRDAFLTSNETTLKAQLTEFRDHKLIKIKKGPDGTEFIFIPLDTDNLQKLMQNIDTTC
ncbi:hypothetical protein MN116_006443 [Schistosoma mekongi]|uniref:Origin recognition complex subunit 2 n=1 Tax=Schistosoma mekongi TaxID=38744 RepID=A0AAE2D4F3_SCHME|nr:hypothetical protein MN116_006443 [Schistosoma mekongi]